MPRKRSIVATYRRKVKKTFRRRARRGKTTVTALTRQSPIAPRLITKLKYCETFSTTLTSGITNDYTFRLNSLFDPNYTGTGHQPYGFDTLASLYNRYRVFKVHYLVQLINNAGQGRVMLVVNNDLASLSVVGTSVLMERPRVYSNIWDQTRSFSKRGKIYLPALNGSTSLQYKSDDRFQADIASSPTESMALHVVFDGNGNQTIVWSVTIDYFAEFFDPKDLAQS